MSEQTPSPSEPDPNWPPPAQYQQAPPQYYAPPRAYIPPGVTLAGWGRRFAGYLIDSIMQMTLSVGIAVAVGFGIYGLATGPDRDSAGAAAGFITYFLILCAWWLLYSPLTMRRKGARNGQTWSKQWLGIRVVREDGEPVTAKTAYLRDVLMLDFVFGFVGSFLFNVPTLVNGLWPLWDERNQALHDKVASTFVIDA